MEERIISVPEPPFSPFTSEGPLRLPGLSPLKDQSWITSLPDLPAQLSFRAHLIETRRDEVIGSLPEAHRATQELLETCVEHLVSQDGWDVGANAVRCPGGAKVPLNSIDPLATLGRLVSEDFCILQKTAHTTEYRLTAAVLCFPAYWRLADKLGQPLTGIHAPVPVYQDDLARRVNRVFEALRPENPVMRYNWGLAPIADLHTPPQAKATWPEIKQSTPLFLRTERQTLRRLSGSDAVVFGIRSSVSPLSGLSPKGARAMLEALDAQSVEMADYKGGAALFAVARAQLKMRARDAADPS
ncbi:MAG: DUF3445 domain-containing protein [Dinoroseobacter sp.]|nr:DUF3445 domain-containing protein [Dinoroseobacter sp.]